ncbi:MAG: HIT domain-containing protein [candidate division WOR-3 bacterium]
MKRLYAPWRIRYLEKYDKKMEKCIFCFPEKKMLIHRDKNFIIILNKYPYTNGHIMVAPLLHNIKFEELDKDNLVGLMEGVQLGIKILKNSYNPQGFNIGINYGKVSGAGVEDHLHIHIVPRWSGDTNFMPVISETKIVSESFESVRKKLKKSLKEVLNGKI